MFSQLNWCWHNPPCKAVFFVNLAQATINKTKQKLYTKPNIQSNRFLEMLTDSTASLRPTPNYPRFIKFAKLTHFHHEHISITDYIGVIEAKLLTIFCIQVFTYISP